MTTSPRLQGQLALVTGVTSGIGAATVRALLGEQMRVIGVGRDPELGPDCVTLAELGPHRVDVDAVHDHLDRVAVA
jgi:NAD(P)-dependent dehydrogenase (short-subunit alcohol dehydrogenase family)